jgi:hypothetical protein
MSGGFFLWLDTTGPQPKLSVAPLCLFAAFFHKGEEACFLVGWDLVLGDVACDSCAVVVAVALDVPPRACFYLSFPAKPVQWELFTESVLPGFACCQLKIFVLCQILDKVAVAVLALTLFLVAAISFAFVSCGGMIGFLFIG